MKVLTLTLETVETQTSAESSARASHPVELVEGPALQWASKDSGTALHARSDTSTVAVEEACA